MRTVNGKHPAGGSARTSDHDPMGLINQQGIHRGDTVATASHASSAHAAFVLNCVDQGVIVAPLNPQWGRAQVKETCTQIDAKLVSFDEISVETSMKSRMSVRFPVPWSDRVKERQNTADRALVVFTSGSGGEPKPAVLSTSNLLSAAVASSARLRFESSSSWLLSLPLHHVSGLSILFRGLHQDAEVIFPPRGEALHESVQRPCLTHTSLVSTQLYRLLQNDEAAKALARMRAVVLGGGPVPEPLIRKAIANGVPLCTSYGMTETAAMITCTEPGDTANHLLSSGRPLIDGTVSIADDSDIRVCGETLFLGYRRPDGSLHRPLDNEGWFRTGDLGYFDADGYLHVTGRKDNMFVSGGENIQPEEIEAALCSLGDIEEAVVVPVNDPEWGQCAVAFVRSRDEATLNFDRLRDALRERLAPYKVPKTILPWPDDLAQPGIKPSRAAFRELARRTRSEA